MEPAANNDLDATNTHEEQATLLTTLNDLQDAIEKGDFETIEHIIHCFHEDLSHNKDLLAELYGSGGKCLTQTDLIITACFHKQGDILYYLLYETDILDHLTDANFDVQKVNKQRMIALRYAICSDDFRMVEELYDYWCGRQYWSEHDINKIENIGCLLEDACRELPKPLDVQVHCLIKFNHFQRDVYTYITNLKTNLSKETNDAKAMGIIIIILLYNYYKYSKLDIIRLPKSADVNKELELKNELEDKSSIYKRAHVYIMYEVYFRKLDFNVALLVLENLEVIKQHLKNRFNQFEEVFDENPKLHTTYDQATKLYNDIECTLYHFIYRSSEDWRLYLSRNRNLTVKKHRVGIYDGQILTNLTIKYDEQKIFNGPVLYLERKNFKKSLMQLKNLFIEHVMTKAPAIIDTIIAQKMAVLENNKSLLVKPLLDDNYLKQNMYMSDHYSLRKIVYYIKAVDNAKEINILMIDRALQVIGEMLKSTKYTTHLFETTKGLLQAALSVDTVNHIHNIREYLSHVDKGQLSTRINMNKNQAQILYGKIKEDLKKILQCIHPILNMYKYILDKSLLEKGVSLLDERIGDLPDKPRELKDESYNLFKKHGIGFEPDFMRRTSWEKSGFSKQLLREIPWLLHNRAELESKKQLFSEHIYDNVAINILPECIENVKRTLKLITTNNDNVTKVNEKLKLKNIDPLPAYPKKKHINGTLNHRRLMKSKDVMLDLKQIKDISGHWNSVIMFIDALVGMEFRMFADIDFNVVNKDSSPDTQAINNVENLLKEIEIACNIQSPGQHQEHSFDGIKELDEIFSKKNKSKPDPLISCLISRIDELKKILEYPKRTSSQLMLRYRRDQKFRLVLEMVVADIANILAECDISSMMDKSAKLLTGINIGNVLDHGNPFIEVIGDTLDSQDFPTELLTKAFMFAKDRNIISEIYDLYKSCLHKDRETIRKCYKGAVNNKFSEYLKLIPSKQY